MMELLEYRSLYQILGFVIITFCIIFVLFIVFVKMALNAMRDDLIDLRKRVDISDKFGHVETTNETAKIHQLLKSEAAAFEPTSQSAEVEIQADTPSEATEDTGADNDTSAPQAELLNKTFVDLGPWHSMDSSHLTEKRKVRIEKVSGRYTDIRPGRCFLGVEEMPPEVGKNYRVYLSDKRRLSTSPVVNITDSGIETRNSIYRISEWKVNSKSDPVPEPMNP